MNSSLPHVTIVTPMYNNAEHVEECIRSIQAQTYPSWTYLIVNNCSTDGSAEIARKHAGLDGRIRVLDNETFLRVAEANHNHALRQVPASSKYCKVVFADDWIYPRCVEEMVAVAEAHPGTALVGAYALEGAEVKWAGLMPPSTSYPGKEVARRYFLERLNVFGTANSLLLRTELVHKRDPFFEESDPHSDRETWIAMLREGDYGFVHQVLTVTRLRAGSLNDEAAQLNSYLPSFLRDLQEHGRAFLTPAEYESCRDELIAEYYNFLAVSLLPRARDEEFWSYHKDRLKTLGIGFSRGRLAAAFAARATRAVLNPFETVEKMRGKR
ncbi:MAG: glycosyltransferase family A protein [Hyphomicrobiaceae bacterium]|nr:glycosyltransferase family A protein [Hyphomicrobiaceae bacterium]